jgi:hypothetical protein
MKVSSGSNAKTSFFSSLISFIGKKTTPQEEHKPIPEKDPPKNKKDVLNEIKYAYDAQKRRWGQQMLPQARELAGLLCQVENPDDDREAKAIDIGVDAWKQGGLECMNHVREMAIEIYAHENGDKPIIDSTNYWWDGVGGWRTNSADLVTIDRKSSKKLYAGIINGFC